MGRLVLLVGCCLAAPLALAAPTVLSIVSELNPVQAGQSFYLMVTYDSPMDTAVNPVLSFPTPGEDPGSFLMPKSSDWVNATTFRQIYEADYVTVNTSTVDVAVDGAQDTLGAAQVPGFKADVFDITPYVVVIPPPSVQDMRGVIDNVFVNPAGSGRVITDADIGKTVEFVIRYNIATDYAGCPNGVTLNYLCPNLVFTNTGGIPLSLTNLSATWASRNAVRIYWTIADGDEQFDSINITVAGGVGRKDDTNIKNSDTALTGVFSIDTKNPTVGSVTPSAATLRSGVPASGVQTLTVAFSEAMDTASTPTLSFPNQSLGTILTATTGNWADSTHYVQNYTVGAGVATFAAVDVRVAGARDANGNLQRVATMPGVFSVSLPAPQVPDEPVAAPTLPLNTSGTATVTDPSVPVVVGPGAAGGTIVLPGTGTTPVTLHVIVNGQPVSVQALPGTQLRIAEVNGKSVLVLVVLQGWATMTASAVGQPMVLAGQVLLSSGSANTVIEAQPLAVAVQVGSLTAPAGSLPAVGSMGLQAGERLQVNDQGAVVAITLGSLKGDTQQPGDAMAFASLPASITVDNKAFARLTGALARLSGSNLAQGLEVTPSGVLLVRDGGQVFQLLPTLPITIDARLPDGLTFTPLGLLRWVRGGVVVQFAPAVADLAGLANAVTAVLPDATIKLGAEGVLQLRTGGQTYVLRPDWAGAGAIAGTPRIGLDEQGRIYLQTGPGARQLLLPSLLNYTQAGAIVSAAMPGAGLAVQPSAANGSMVLTLGGQAWRLVPQWALPTGSAAQVPPLAGPWWMGADGLLYLRQGNQVQAVRITD
ncbi:hypothetical protein [Acidovorax sp. CF316]|uniref:hypothetical protein n=1 Tax=Acidovorax sp. CF316 TaxID=1144317 RepID=UPI0011B28FC7|nr:hypothetical protein [Acidovorax sp. CF316]